MLFFAINVFAEIPHSYVTENPDKEVTQTETLKKYKEKAELNISVTKLNSEEIEGVFDPEQNKIYFSLDNTKYGIQPGDHIYIAEELQEVPSISTTNGRRKINGMLNQKVLKDGNLEYTVTNKNNTTEIEVSYSNNERELKTEKNNPIYIGILDNQYNIKKILKSINKKSLRYNYNYKFTYNYNFSDEYDGGVIYLNQKDIYNLPKGITTSSNPQTIEILHIGGKKRRILVRDNFYINGTKYDQKEERVYIPLKHEIGNQAFLYMNSDVRFNLRFENLKKGNYSFNVKFEIEDRTYTGSPSNGGYHYDYYYYDCTFNLHYKPSKIIGDSLLEVKEYYPSPEYIAFNSCNLSSPTDIALENALRDVKLTQTTGKGLVTLEHNDILEINGKKYTIGAGGNLPEQSDTLGNINFKFKVENGKIRLALTSWGVLEPDRLLTINASREGHPIMEHKMIIKSPRRVEGVSTLKFTEKYPIRDIVRFQGISLTAPNIGGIEPPIPAGVSYKSNDGYGIPFMKEGDILEVQCETMRAIKQYTIDSKNSLKHQTIDLPGTVLSLLVEDGKLRLGLNNWLVNKNTVLNFRVIRGVNEISNTSMTLEVPKAPFDILKNGILDFGKLIQGSKNKKAETSILLEMHQDISNVKYSLSTTTPELVNSSGATLQARDLQAGVQKQGNKRHLVRIIGRLDVPEKQELGVYRGSVLLNVTIK